MAKRLNPVAEAVSKTNVMPRATDKQVAAAKRKAEAAARITSMVNDQVAAQPKQRAGRRKADPAAQDIHEADRRHPVVVAIDVEQEDGKHVKVSVMPDNTLAVIDDTPTVKAVEKPVYQGLMLALRDRLKAGRYDKMANGQPACGDELSQILGQLEPKEVIEACLIALDTPNTYTHLNVGQQSMNLRNRLRAALKKGMFGMGVVHEAVEDVVAKRPAAPKQ